MVIRVELAKAGIPAFEGIPLGTTETRSSVVTPYLFSETRAPLVGMIAFENKALALFVRHWFYWEVHLTKPLPFEPAQELFDNFWRVVRVKGYSGAEEPPADGVSYYHVDSVPGLGALVATLLGAFGDGCAAEPLRLTRLTDSWILLDSFKVLPPPGSIAELDALELAGLAALAHASKGLRV